MESPCGPRAIDPARIVVLDIETTGLDGRVDHITELAIADLDGSILWSLALEPGSVDTVEALRVLYTQLSAAEAVAGHNLTRFDLPFLEATSSPAGRAGMEVAVVRPRRPRHVAARRTNVGRSHARCPL